MIFALADYFNYRTRRGRYSDEALVKFGLKRANESHFLHWRTIPFGSLLFVSTANSGLSWLVMYVTNSVLSHTALMHDQGVVHDVTTAGVLRHPLSDYFDGESHLMVRPPLPGVDVDSMRSFTDSTLGHRYNWSGVVRLAMHIVFANHTSFAWRIAGDILIALGLLTVLAWLHNPAVAQVLLSIIVVYFLIVIVNQTVRRATVERSLRLMQHDSKIDA